MIEPEPASPIFGRYILGQAYDEMFEGVGRQRPHYAGIHERLCGLPFELWRERQHAADLAFVTQGITFTVYGQTDGVERIFPFDLLPRLLTSAEWATIERGLIQRITALNCFFTTSITRAGFSRRRRSSHARASVPAFSPRDDWRPRAARLLSDRRGHRSRSWPGRPVPGARGQPARAQRRLVHARQPANRQAGVSAALRALPCAPDRSVSANAARAFARDRA